MAPAPEWSTQKPVAAAPEQGSTVADKVIEEEAGGLPHLAEKEYMWIGQPDKDGLPEVMDEEMEEATIQELLRQTTTMGKRLNVS